MGTPDFAVPSLEILIKNNYKVVGVVTQPDKPVGRSSKLIYPPVKEIALKNNILVYQPEKVKNNEFIDLLKDIEPDLIVVVAFGQILPKSILDIPKLGCINVHGSILPKYRGAAPIQWSIINGEKITGVTTMYMDVGMDTGDMILKNEIPICDDDTAEVLFDKVSDIGAEVLVEKIKLIEKGNVLRIPQDNSLATYAPMLKKESGIIDWTRSSNEIANFIKGTYPWPGAYSYYNGNRMKVFKIEYENKNFDAKVGQIVEVTKDSIIVQSGDGLVLIKELQFDGSKRMTVKDYLIGHTIQKGIILNGEANEITN